ncbi:hypothetical protein IGB42_02719 [Andreprevotia sp. IGB-42]|uniref:PilN domain-containing protein n=1 Tax=Andreprevotia sp. IGB-42 TaxID=2497473 RepID=UPI0013594442|nr:PilN domain-containing protein [Andreprevotia sp. IGB-42]KAF0812875.1 hypothetical protein IGB42_02719 [Andreprevotia sp. IGB-42]
MTQQINLFNPLFRKKTKIFGANFIGLTLAILTVSGLLAWGTARYQVYRLTQQLQVLEESKAKLAANRNAESGKTGETAENQQVANHLAEVNKTLLERQMTMSKFQSSSRSFSAYLDGFAGAQISGVWLTVIDIKADKLSLEGQALSAPLIPAYLDALKQQRVFTGQQFGALQLGSVAGSNAIRFELQNVDSGPGKEKK